MTKRILGSALFALVLGMLMFAATLALNSSASHAQKAADFLKSLQPQTEEPGELLAA